MKGLAKVYRDCFSKEELEKYIKLGLESRISVVLDVNGKGEILNVKISIFKRYEVRMTKKQFLLFDESIKKNVKFKLPKKHEKKEYLRVGLLMVVF